MWIKNCGWFAVLSLTAALSANSAGPNPGFTGAPFESSCASCHGGAPGTGNVTIAFPNGLFYTPGVAQHLTVTIADAAQKRWGFQLTARQESNATAQAGQFTTGADGYTQLSCLDKTYQLETFNAACINNVRLPLQYIEHTLAGSRLGTRGPVSFQFDWTPPGAGAGNVVLYVAANAANGDTTSNGDHIYTAEYTLAPAASGPSIAAVVNGGSFQPGIAPGAWVTILGSGLSSTSRSWAAADFVNGALPTELDSVSVTIDGKAAYVAYVSPNQINAVAPPDSATGPVTVEVTASSGLGATATAQLQLTAPAFFLWSGKYPVATRPDYSLVTVAKPGDVIILWGTGCGPTNPALDAGRQPSAGTLYSVVNPPSVSIGNLTASVIGAALSPGSAGLYQIAIQVPDAAPDGDLPITMESAGQVSPTGVYLTVHK